MNLLLGHDPFDVEGFDAADIAEGNNPYQRNSTDAKWYWSDTCEADHGPYDTEAEATAHLELYLLGHTHGSTILP